LPTHKFARKEPYHVALSPGNTDDRRPVPSRVKQLFGKLFADKGYISQPLFQPLDVLGSL
jgi:hypothetical protein